MFPATQARPPESTPIDGPSWSSPVSNGRLNGFPAIDARLYGPELIARVVRSNMTAHMLFDAST